MNENLKACPFCGGTTLRVQNAAGTWTVTCGTWSLGSGCGATNGIYANEEKARDAWNRRAEVL